MRKPSNKPKRRGLGGRISPAADQGLGGGLLPGLGQTLSSGSTAILNSPTIKRSGHLMDLSLITKYKRKPTLFDQLSEDIQDRILRVETREWAEVGVKLSPTEIKIVDSLCVLLHKKSQTEDPKAKDYYTGNQGTEPVVIEGLGAVPGWALPCMS